MDGEDGGYLNQAAKELTAAMEREKEGEISSAICGYRMAVDILITGVQGEPSVYKSISGWVEKERDTPVRGKNTDEGAEEVVTTTYHYYY